MMRLFGQKRAQFPAVRNRRHRAVHDLLAVERTDVEFVEMVEHVVALVQIAEPPRSQRGQFFRFAEIKPYNARTERQDGAVVGQSRADGVDHGDMTTAHALHQPGHAQKRIAPEDKRIEPCVGHARVEHIDFFQSRNAFEIKPVVENKQIPALHKGDAHAPREEAVLGVSGISRPRREQRNDGFRRIRGRERAQ